MPDEQPTLTDGTVTLRAWRDDDVAEAVAGHDDEMALWLGWDPADVTEQTHSAAIARWRQRFRAGEQASFVVEHDGRLVGSVDLTREGSAGASLRWALYAGHRGHGHAARAVRVLVDWAFSDPDQGGWGLQRVEARIDPRNDRSRRVATRAGMRLEGMQRIAPGMGDRADATSYAVFARLATDPPLSDRVSTYVFDFADGDKDQKDLLGGKGANLAEMTNLGLPVPPGFTITTEACRAYLRDGGEPEGLADEVTEHLAALEKTMGAARRRRRPAAGSVRSGAKFSMPGMMETVLNVGLNDDLGRRPGAPERGRAVRAGLLPAAAADVRRHRARHRRRALLRGARRGEAGAGTESDLDLDADALRALVETSRASSADASGREFPQDPREQLDLAVRAVFDSWNTDRARLYRRQERIPDDLGTAVNVQAMVFGNFGMDSGSGVAFTRDPASGAQGEYGDYLQNAQGEDVVAGIRNTVTLADFAEVDRTSHDELMAIMARLERHYRDMCDIEFTVERGKLWMLQTRVGKRTPEAAFRIAIHMVDEGLIQMDEAVLRVTGDQLAQLMFPRFDETAERTLLATGMNASPGAAVGKAVFDSDTAVEWAERGEDVILVRKETNPDDLRGMVAARGILTSRGGKTSHAAVVARGMGRTCVCGAESLDVDTKAKEFRVRDGETDQRGRRDLHRRHDRRGLRRRRPGLRLARRAALRGREVEDDLAAVARIMAHADGARRLRVRANSDTPEDSARARRFGAQGIGLCRTEHMFLGDRRELVERLIVAEDEAGAEAALDALLPLQRQDFTEIFEAMDGLPGHHPADRPAAARVPPRPHRAVA